MRTMHISNRTAKMLCGTEDKSGVIRRYLSAKPEVRHEVEYTPCEKCLEKEPLALLALTNLGDDDTNQCWRRCGRTGTHRASYDGRWTCEDCIY